MMRLCKEMLGPRQVLTVHTAAAGMVFTAYYS